MTRLSVCGLGVSCNEMNDSPMLLVVMLGPLALGFLGSFLHFYLQNMYPGKVINVTGCRKQVSLCLFATASCVKAYRKKGHNFHHRFPKFYFTIHHFTHWGPSWIFPKSRVCRVNKATW